ncbi:MAG: energy transducer TonB [Deltaproteobacteria bacterium]|nr:energy transducer TonB [Deltaproteobacteria bacterium]
MEARPTITNSLNAASKVRKRALGVSFFSHLVLILIIQQFAPEPWHIEELKSYRVEFIRDAIDDIPFEKLSEKEKENSIKKIMEEEQKSEETISLDTADKRYSIYAGIIKKRLTACWGYPREAKERSMEGKAYAVFSLSRDGHLTNVEITGSSGHELLDHEGLDAIRRAAPFPPFPDTIKVERLNIKVTFDYRLSAS